MKKVSTIRGEADQEFSRSKADDQVGLGRSIELVLRVERSRRSTAGAEAGHDSESHCNGEKGKARAQSRVPVTASNAWPSLIFRDE